MKTLPLTLCLFGLSFALLAQPPHPPQPPNRGERGAARERGQPMIERWMNHLERTQPEEHERLMNLRQEDPAAFREEIRTHLARIREQPPLPPGRGRPDRFAAEVEAVRNAATDQEKQKALAALRNAVSEMLEQRMQMREERIQSIQADLERLREQHNADSGRKEELVQETLDSLLTPPEPAGE